MNRRKFLGITTALGAAALFAGGRSSVAKTFKFPPEAGDISYEVVKTDTQWQKVLSDMQYQVLRHEDTERSFTSVLNDEKRVGVFHCAGCDLAAYKSETKFDSGTGWPSFFQEIEDSVRTKNDYSFFGPFENCRKTVTTRFLEPTHFRDKAVFTPKQTAIHKALTPHNVYVCVYIHIYIYI